MSHNHNPTSENHRVTSFSLCGLPFAIPGPQLCRGNSGINQQPFFHVYLDRLFLQVQHRQPLLRPFTGTESHGHHLFIVSLGYDLSTSKSSMKPRVPILALEEGERNLKLAWATSQDLVPVIKKTKIDTMPYLIEIFLKLKKLLW